jgi:hypothetical protein
MAIDNTLPLTNFDYPRIAVILVEALYYGDRKTAKRYELTTRTLRTYRHMLNTNNELSQIFLERCKEFESNWAKDLPSAIIAGISFLKEAAHEADYKNPDAIVAISNAVKVLAEVGLTKELIDARIGKFNREGGEEIRSMESSAIISA